MSTPEELVVHDDGMVMASEAASEPSIEEQMKDFQSPEVKALAARIRSMLSQKAIDKIVANGGLIDELFHGDIRKAERERIAEEARVAEAARIAQEAADAEAARAAEEARLAREAVEEAELEALRIAIEAEEREAAAERAELPVQGSGIESDESPSAPPELPDDAFDVDDSEEV